MNLTVSHRLLTKTKHLLPKAALGLSVLIWSLLAILVVSLLLMFTWFFWHFTTTTPCYKPNCTLLFAWFNTHHVPLELYAVLYEISFVVPTAIWIALAVWVFRAKPGWIWSYVFALFFLVGWYGEISVQYVRRSLPETIDYALQSLHLTELANHLATLEVGRFLWKFLKMLADNLGVLVIFTFPNGKFLPRWSLVYVTSFFLISLGYSLPSLHDTFWNYNNWGFPFTFFMHLALAFGLAYGLLVRYRSSGNLIRSRVRGVIPAMLVNIVVSSGITYFQALIMPKVLVSDFQIQVVQPWILLFNKWLNGICMVWWALAVAQAIVRQQLFDSRFVLNRAFAYSALILSTGVLYGLIVGGLGTFFRSANVWLSVLATGVIAVVFQPLLIFFRQSANRLFYGERNDPYRAISKFGKQLEMVYKPEELALTIVHTVATTLRLPYVALKPLPIEAGQSISLGEPVAQLLEFPMVVKGASVGLLIVSTRFVGESFSPSETRLLEDLAARAAVAVQEALLNQELRLSKEAIVLAREEERKRIRRDLHDGLGPMLASLSFQLQATRSLLIHDPKRADALLETSAQNVQDAISDIRRLVYGLRPPALDDLGLDGALRQQVGQMLGVYTDTQIETLEPLPAAVEVAAYRIACEALNNVSKHANAKHVKLSLRIEDGGLKLIVQDDGIGLKNTQINGVGMHSMRERVLELGGKLELESLQGTRVTAWLPLRK